MRDELKFIYGNSIYPDDFNAIVIAEQTMIEERHIRMRNALKRLLKNRGKNPPDELLDAATNFAMNNHILPTLDPKREGWFIEMLCCFCDGKEFNIKE